MLRIRWVLSSDLGPRTRTPDRRSSWLSPYERKIRVGSVRAKYCFTFYNTFNISQICFNTQKFVILLYIVINDKPPLDYSFVLEILNSKVGMASTDIL